MVTGLGVDRLPTEDVREALRLLGHRTPPTARSTAVRELREELGGRGVVRSLLDRAPEHGGDAFARLAATGPLAVEELLGRGWWGRGVLPPPLDWLQRRALVQVGEDGLVHATTEAVAGFLERSIEESAQPDQIAGSATRVRVEEARCVVTATDAAALERAAAVAAAGLRVLAPTVAVSDRSASSVSAALRAAGIELHADAAVAAASDMPALPGTPEEAVGPRGVRTLLERGVAERRQLQLQYFASSRGGAATERVVDPWTFRDDLLVGYCHLRQDERTFAVDRIGRAVLLASPVQVPPS